MKRLMLGLYIIILMATSITSAHAKDRIVLWKSNYETEANLAFIKLAADLTVDEYGEYELLPSEPLEQGRAFANLDKPNDINVIIAGINLEREQSTNTIYIPLERGLTGFRLCFIKKGNEDIFANINTLREFRRHKMYIGVGAHWPDKDILNFNKLPVTTSPIAEDLYAMLDKRRFDCFSRSIKEITDNLAKHRNNQISIEENIAFIYPLADFIYVSKTEERLKERLEKGLKMAINNGQFYELFDRYFKNTLREHNLYGRKLFFLKNENMSERARAAINRYGIASFSAN